LLIKDETFAYFGISTGLLAGFRPVSALQSRPEAANGEFFAPACCYKRS